MMNRPLVLKSIPFGMPRVKHQQALGETPFMTRVTVSRSNQNCLASKKLTRLQVSKTFELSQTSPLRHFTARFALLEGSLRPPCISLLKGICTFRRQLSER